MSESIASIDSSASLKDLRSELKARGLDRKPTARLLWELTGHALIVAVGLGLILFGAKLWLIAIGIAVFSFGQVGVATNTHTSAHFATTRRRWLNQLLTYLGYPLFLGLGATYWWTKHNVRHHGAPNVMEIDEDAQLKPWFAFTQEEVEEAPALAQAYYRHQWLAFPLVLLMSVNLQTNSIMHLVRVARSPGGMSTTHRLDTAALVLHWLLWVVVPLAIFPPLNVLAFTLVRLVILSGMLFSIFAPAHVPAEAQAVHADARGSDPVLLQTSNTLNFRTGPVGTWLISGLQYQIEHHLFPGVSHVHYPQLSPLVAAYCARNGYPYRTLGWGEALWKTVLNFVEPKPISERLERLEHIA